jgi:hypothetical protein
MDVTKEQIVFFLSRHVKAAKNKSSFDHAAAANAGMPYEERNKRTKDVEDRAVEAACLEKALEIVKSCESL